MALDFAPETGHLAPGPHAATVDDVKSALVDAFSGSSTRKPIYEDWLELREHLSALVSLERQWLDGSYATMKLDPEDLDLATFAASDEVEALGPAEEAELNALVSGRPECAPRCDSFLIVEYPEDHALHAVSVSLREGFAEDFFGAGPAGPGTKGYIEVTS